MEKAKKLRAVIRTAFTKTLNSLNDTLGTQNVNRAEALVLFELLEEKYKELETLSREVFQYLLEANASEEQLTTEIDTTDEYKTKFGKARIRVLSETMTINGEITSERRKTYKLPKIELLKFGGNVREWLQFWSSFKKIHEEREIADEDKFQYLIQAMVPGSRASELVQSFPPTGDNYPKVINSLKNRFGRDELLVEVYVRELLTLVLQNAMKVSEKVSLASLYDKLESHLRALETLGVTTDKCAAMLYPLVESSLPEELLRVWQRSSSMTATVTSNTGNAESKDRLTKLMEFLQAEVENEERITMAVTGFGLAGEQETVKKYKPKGDWRKNIPSATGLLTIKADRGLCVFCGNDHVSTECEKARKMSLIERRDIVKQKRACFKCLNVGHIYKRCRTQITCAWCSKKHAMLMCPEVPGEKGTSEQGTGKPTVCATEQNLANCSSSPAVYLMTLRANLKGEKVERMVRVIIDTGSQKSYVLKSVAIELGYTPIAKETIVHSLFGGGKTEPREHNVYIVHLRTLDGQYACNFKVTDEDRICDNVSGIERGQWLEELNRMDIELSDVGNQEDPISVLIGADIAGKLLTGNSRVLSSGLVAIETLLGWTLIGKVPGTNTESDSVLMITSMFLQEASISDLWSLDVLGITDPVQKRTQEETEERVRNALRESIVQRTDGRYVIQLPWIEDHAPLHDNRSLARRRLETLRRRLLSDKIYEEYDKVLQQWLEEGIIERVPREEIDNFAHYLPHRHVVKLNSTTKVRPVFDASAREKDHPSLNQCLEKGPNMIELIPAVLLNFRKNNIGVISDIKGAFLQISIEGSDRDSLRFLWWRDAESDLVDIYRHTRVVFGVTSSPFVLGAVIELHLQRALERETLDIFPNRSGIIMQLMNSFYVDNCVTSVKTSDELREFMHTATSVMAEGRFELRGWESTGDGNSESLTNVLGLTWDKAKDTLSLNPTLLSHITEVHKMVTKRTILSAAHRIFDPIGFSCPVNECLA